MRKLATCLLGAGLSLLLAASANAQTFSHYETGTDDISAGTSTISFLKGADTGVFCGNGGSDVVLSNLVLSSTAEPTAPDVIDGPYSLVMHLTDDTSGETGDLTFTGSLKGPVAKNSANVANTFDAPLTQTITLGGLLYVVTIGPYTPVGPPGGRQGAIGAHVSCVPEPGSMALLGVGALPLVGLLRRRR
jgi:hypothetical protein